MLACQQHVVVQCRGLRRNAGCIVVGQRGGGCIGQLGGWWRRWSWRWWPGKGGDGENVDEGEDELERAHQGQGYLLRAVGDPRERESNDNDENREQ